MRRLHFSAAVVACCLLSTVGQALALDNRAGGVGGGALGWSTCNLRQCKNACVDTYPGGGGPLATCKRLCDQDACSVVFNIARPENRFSTGGSSGGVLAPAN